MISIRTVLSIATNMNLEIEKLDAKTSFLHGDLEEEIYMQQHKGFEEKGKENLVCKLRKSLYGLKQSPNNGTRSLNPSWWTMDSTRHNLTIMSL